MKKSTHTYFIALALPVTLLFSPGCESDKLTLTTGPGATRKPFTIYYAKMSEGRKTGYVVMDFQIEDGKAVTEVKTYYAAKVIGSDMKWHHESTQRHVETVDGRPLIWHRDSPGYSQRTYTVGADGKVQVRVIDRTATQPAAEETTTWPEDAILSHGHYLLMRSKGVNQGTMYTFREFRDGKSHLMHVRIGPRKKVELPEGEMNLSEVTLVGKPPEVFKDRKPWKVILHVDDDLIWRKIRLDGDPIKMTLIACTKAEAMRLPAPE